MLNVMWRKENSHDADFDRGSARELFEKAGITSELIIANLRRIDTRHERHSLLKQQADFEKAHEREIADQQARRVRLQNYIARMQTEIAEGDLRIRDLEGKLERCVAAKSDQYSDGHESRESRQLGEEIQRLLPQIRQLRIALKEEEDIEHDPPNAWPRMEQRPAALARAVRYELARKNVGRSKEKTAELKSILAAAQKRCKLLERQLIGVEKRRQDLARRQEELAPQRLLPENFVIIKKIQPTNDERMKEDAKSFGFGPNDPGYRITTGR
ncbi:hypothetical protein [Aeoliella sp.]|uniref:hypothetical protein n=1 Tax=Aeoliella sp. TaxID=2795800 RepID=UPI003CCC3920